MQIKARIGQGTAGSKCKNKTHISKSIVQATEKQPSEILRPNTSKTQDIAIPIPDDTTPSIKFQADTSTRVIDRNILQDVKKEITIYPDPVYRPPHKAVKISMPEIPGSLLDIDPELNTNFKENSQFQ